MILGEATQGLYLSGHVFVHVLTSHTLFQDLWRSGATLAEILLAGQWKSAAFLRYLDEAELEKVRNQFPCAVTGAMHCIAGSCLPGCH